MAHTDTVQGLEDTPIRVVAEQERKGRNRPGTASGIVFVTMEDETGPINVILRPELVEKQRRETLAARLLGVYGQLESRHGVTHLVAKRLVDLTPLLGRLATRSRDFH